MSHKTIGVLIVLIVAAAGVRWMTLNSQRQTPVTEQTPVTDWEPLSETTLPAVPKPLVPVPGMPGKPTADELPAIRPSRFLNTTQDVSYVGTDACRECHAEEYQSYQQTAHSKALGEIDLAQEPPDAQFDHAASRRSYRIYREGGELRHRELPQASDGSETVFADYPVRYVIGSGHHSRSYLVEADGFLLESPATWYASTQHWGMSPGYDRPDQIGFERMVDLGCLFCHAGRVDARGDNRYRVEIHEQTIGCESCHGPGSLHVARHRDGEPYAGSEDLTIVNPDKLSREASESVCGLCHLLGQPSVWMPSRDPMGFRPGLLLSDFRLDYSLERPDRSMTVAGHIEQMKRSRCYQESESMTCTTCHDPHGRPPKETKVDYFRQKCLNCHEDGCHLEDSARLAQNAEDNCIACHMAQAPTEIPHFVFTHHRIGFHDADEPTDNQSDIGKLVPIADVAHLPQVIQDRALGVAYLEFMRTQRSPAAQQTYHQRAKTLLSAAYRTGLRDAELEALLARLAWEERDFDRATQLATAALEKPSFLSPAHAIALYVLSDSYMQMSNFPAADRALEQLVDYRRYSTDWKRLAEVRKRMGDDEGAIAALEQAVRIAPFDMYVHQLLANGYQFVGKSEDSQRHRDVVRALEAMQSPQSIQE